MKIAAFDMDGTIYFDGKIPEEIAQSIARWRAEGNIAIAATGKSIHSARTSLDPFGVTMDYGVLYNGTVVTDSAFEVLYEEHLPQDAVAAIARHLEGIDGLNLYCTTLEGADGLVCRGVSGPTNHIISNPRPMGWQQLMHEQVVLLTAWAPDRRDLQREVDEWVTAHFDLETSDNVGFYDIIPPGHNKGWGISWLLKHLGIERDAVELYTFGDSFNDLPMHALADVSFSFPWAPASVREQVTHVVPGVAQALEEL
ncbi:HAD family hydrolase [Corynebacterium flavescens]|uniref:HAD family hydrolase n=1 Tax=Corynebacterium flavescens TaxID=28028 RepID=UPI003FCFE2D4